MPVFFFDIDDGSGLVVDNEGSDHADLAAAHHEAVDTLSQIGRDVFAPRSDREITIQIRREDGKRLMRASLRMTSVLL